ncbi:MAG: hypothetical protein Q9183_004404 [Haloplaca sp. 2 TL-2023]
MRHSKVSHPKTQALAESRIMIMRAVLTVNLQSHYPSWGRIRLCDLHIDDELDELCTHLHTTSTEYGTLDSEETRFGSAIADMSTSMEPTIHGRRSGAMQDAAAPRASYQTISQVQDPSANEIDGQLERVGPETGAQGRQS